jgi:hypothetical protein
MATGTILDVRPGEVYSKIELYIADDQGIETTSLTSLKSPRPTDGDYYHDVAFILTLYL